MEPQFEHLTWKNIFFFSPASSRSLSDYLSKQFWHSWKVVQLLLWGLTGFSLSQVHSKTNKNPIQKSQATISCRIICTLASVQILKVPPKMNFLLYNFWQVLKVCLPVTTEGLSLLGYHNHLVTMRWHFEWLG